MGRSPVTTRRAAIARLAVALTTITALACSTEDMRAITDAVAPPSSSGELTIWTSDPSPSPIEVAVDGVTVGTLTRYRSSAPACGTASTAGTITIARPAGSYTITARETQANGYWAATRVSVRSGECRTFVLNP